MQRKPIRTILAAAVLGLCASLLAAAPAAAVPNGWSSSHDYATEEFGNPWDFSSDSDWDIQARYESRGITNPTISGGTLKFGANPQGYVLIGSAHYGPEALHWGTSTWLRPIQASAYNRLVFRMYSSLGSDEPAGFAFYTCPFTIPSCDNSRPFFTKPGWNTYSFDLSPADGWTGNVYGFRITPAGVRSGSFEIDWIRVIRPGGSPTPVTEPVPVVIDPDRIGGTDYAASVLANPWDFSGPEDVAAFANINNVSFTNGAMRACNTSNDPGFILPIAGPIDGNAFNRFYARIHYEGCFSLADAPGGGMNARILYHIASDGGAYQVSQDIVVYPGWNEIDLELATSPPSLVNDEHAPGPGWAGQTITEIRFDPHEDRGVRCFTVDEMRLSTADFGAPRFSVRFRDDALGTGAPSAGTTAEIFADTSRGTFGGTRLVAGLPVTGGVNTFNYTGALPQGVYWIWVRLTDGSGKQSSAYARGPLAVIPSQPLAANTVTGVDSNVRGAAALVNLTMTQAQQAGYITADQCSLVDSLKNEKSNGNFAPGQDIANLGVVPIDGAGRFCIYNKAPLHLVADVQGVFAPDGALEFSEFAPPRFDTRRGTKPSAGGLVEVPTGAPSGTTAVLVNLTMTEAEAPGYITADKCSVLRADRNPDKPSSNGNYVVGQNIANLSVVPIDPDGKFCIFTRTRVNVIADVQGRFSPDGQLRFRTSPNNRTDTRSGPKPGTRAVRRVATGLPAGTPYALVNLTMTRSDGGGYITAGRCADVVALSSKQSNGNYSAGRDVANLSVVPLDADGSFCVFTETPVHFVVDVQGGFTPGGSLGFAMGGPWRQLDTRR